VFTTVEPPKSVDFYAAGGAEDAISPWMAAVMKN
jgi:hypothetical protein